MVAKKNNAALGMRFRPSLCSVEPIAHLHLGFVNSGWDTGKSELIQRRVTKMVEATPRGDWVKDLGTFLLSGNYFYRVLWEGRGCTIMVS